MKSKLDIGPLLIHITTMRDNKMSEEIKTFLNEICLDLGICDPLYELESLVLPNLLC